jgi:hypothetical protein
MTHQIFDTRDDSSGTSHEIHKSFLEPRGYIPAKGGPCTSESTRLDRRIDRVGRRTHTQRLEYALVDKVHVAHAGQLGHNVRANYVHLLSTLSCCQNRGAKLPYLIIVLHKLAKLDRWAQVPEVSRQAAHSVLWPVREVVSEGR